MALSKNLLDTWCTVNITTQAREGDDKTTLLKPCDVTRMDFQHPLRVNLPRTRGPGPAVRTLYVGRAGGQCGAQTACLLRVAAGDNTGVRLCTTSPCTVMPGSSRQVLSGRAGHQSLLCYTPDPYRLLPGARFSHSIHLQLKPTSSVVLVDWISAPIVQGPADEDFKFFSSIDCNIDGETVFSDNTSISRRTVTVDAYSVFGTIVLLGPVITEHTDRLDCVRRIARQRRSEEDAVKCGTLKRHDVTHGCYVKFACPSMECARDLLDDLMTPFRDVCGRVYVGPDECP